MPTNIYKHLLLSIALCLIIVMIGCEERTPPLIDSDQAGAHRSDMEVSGADTSDSEGLGGGQAGERGAGAEMSGAETSGMEVAGAEVAGIQSADMERSGVEMSDMDAPDMDAPDMDAPDVNDPGSSAVFLDYIQANLKPGRLPTSECETRETHHECVSAQGCGWLRTVKDQGVCREDPVSRCLTSGECVCRASDFHGDPNYDDDLELFLPLSVTWKNLAARTSSYQGGQDQYLVTTSLPEILNESYLNFTSRTDFTYRSISIDTTGGGPLPLIQSEGLTLTFKVMPTWDQEPEVVSGRLFAGMGIEIEADQSELSLNYGGQEYALTTDHSDGETLKHYQCTQVAIVIPETGDATAYLGGAVTAIPTLNMENIRRGDTDLVSMSLGPVNAKLWDLRVYGQRRLLSAAEIAEIGKRCGAAGDYQIPEGYPNSNRRYSWGMGGYDIVPNHAVQHFASGVYHSLWIPEEDIFPPSDEIYRAQLMRMVGFWDRWHEQMFFEMDMIPFVDLRDLEPEGSLNSYRAYPNPPCEGEQCGETALERNPCRYVTDLFQGFNWLPEDFPGEPTSADHRRVATRGGWTRWDRVDPDLYGSWQRPVHEHGHTAHFTLMRTYQKVHHYIRGIAGEGFAEIMLSYVLAGVRPWMTTGLTYYPTIPLAFEGRWNGQLERHVFKSPQPYQERNIDDLGLGARFYGLGAWWTFVSHYAAKPYLIGRISGDSDLTPGTTLQKMRFYLAQEGLDLGELFGDYAAHTVTWDWPEMGHHYHQQERDPFQGIEAWCTQNSGPDCTVDRLKIQAELSAEFGTNNEWVDSPEGLDPGGFAYSTIRISNAAPGSLYAISLEFDMPEFLYPNTDFLIGLRSTCQDDPRFFSSRIVVADAGSEGQEVRSRRPQYYKIPGRSVDEVMIRVPEGGDANIYVLAVPTPPFELEDVSPFVNGFSLTWPFRYRVQRLDEVPAGRTLLSPITLDDDQMLRLSPQEGLGFTYDCFAEQPTYMRPEANFSLTDFIGDYERQPIMNGYHEVTVELTGGELYWHNAAGVRWRLFWRDSELWTGEDCPYGSQEVEIDYSFIDDEARVTALIFLGERYVNTHQN